MFVQKSLVDLTHKLESAVEKMCCQRLNAEMESKRGVTYVSNGSGLGPSPSSISSSKNCMYHLSREMKDLWDLCNLASVFFVLNDGAFLQ